MLRRRLNLHLEFRDLGWILDWPNVFLQIPPQLGRVAPRAGAQHSALGIEQVFGIGAVAAVILVLGIPVQKRFYRALHWEKVEAIQAEIRTIMAKHPDKTIEMGVGQNTATYPRTFYKTLLVLKGHPYTIDAAPAMEMTMMKIPLNDDLLSLLRGCSTDLWLIPKGEKPFAMTGYYGTPTVGQAFIDTFNASYAKAESLDYFDVWACEG